MMGSSRFQISVRSASLPMGRRTCRILQRAIPIADLCWYGFHNLPLFRTIQFRCPVQDDGNGRGRLTLIRSKDEKPAGIGGWLILRVFWQLEQRDRSTHLERRSQPHWYRHQLPIERNVVQLFAVAAPLRPSAAVVKRVHSSPGGNLPFWTRAGKRTNVNLASAGLIRLVRYPMSIRRNFGSDFIKLRLKKGNRLSITG